MNGHAIIAGFGVPGRAIAEVLDSQQVAYCVIELNPDTARRCAPARVQIITGDVRDPAVLRQAGIEEADMLAIVIPDEQAMLAAISVARELNPRIRILARCWYTSVGLKAIQLGANEVVVAEKVVAAEFARLLENVTSKETP